MSDNCKLSAVHFNDLWQLVSHFSVRYGHGVQVVTNCHQIIGCQIPNRFLPLGYIFSGEIAHEMWQVAAEYEVNDNHLINVEMAIDALKQ